MFYLDIVIMKNSLLIFFSALLLLLGSTAYGQNREVRSVSDFNHIRAGGSWNVILKKGDRNEVLIEAKNLDLDKVITEVKNGTLDIRLEKGNYRNMGLEVTVTFIHLDGIHSSGSGNLKCISDLRSDELEIVLSGSGNATFNSLLADELDLTMSGSGDLSIAGGSVGDINVSQSGSGNLKAINLISEAADINKSGSGNASLTINESLSLRSSGSGNVEYKGNPSVNSVSISGSGRLLKK